MQQSGCEGSPNSLTLPGIGNDQAHVGAVIAVGAHVAERNDVTPKAVLQFGDESQPTRVFHIRQHAHQ